ncbi:MAG: dihydropteroate synthase [Oceanococcus sp.]
MGVLNVTPDSFSDGGQYDQLGQALAQAVRMQAEGADIIDIGGESTRPGAAAVDLEEERRRIVPLLRKLREHVDLPISVDTSKPELMSEAIAHGAGMINDVNALRASGALSVLAQNPHVACVLMHMRGEPRTMQENPQYEDVFVEVCDFLQSRKEASVTAGLRAGQVVVDPGIGFGKSLAHNLKLLRETPALVQQFGLVLIGVSRKSMFAQLLGDRPPNQRIQASVQTAMLAAQAGAAILRVHDVKQTCEALRLLQAIETA